MNIKEERVHDQSNITDIPAFARIGLVLREMGVTEEDLQFLLIGEEQEESAGARFGRIATVASQAFLERFGDLDPLKFPNLTLLIHDFVLIGTEGKQVVMAAKIEQIEEAANLFQTTNRGIGKINLGDEDDLKKLRPMTEETKEILQSCLQQDTSDVIIRNPSMLLFPNGPAFLAYADLEPRNWKTAQRELDQAAVRCRSVVFTDLDRISDLFYVAYDQAHPASSTDEAHEADEMEHVHISEEDTGNTEERNKWKQFIWKLLREE